MATYRDDPVTRARRSLMTSAFGWLDFSERDRREMLEIVGLFREKGTLDELGFGVIRDAFANYFFPGTSTIHSRPRYLLFVPWIFLRLERRRVPSARFDASARWDQAQLVNALVAGGESQGVIGIEARAALQRPPSAAYWGGLRTLGILRYPYSYARYVAEIDRHYRAERSALRSDDGELVEASHANWHTGLPPAPPDLLVRTDFRLTADEAEYLRERIVTGHPRSLFAALLAWPVPGARVTHPWQHPHAHALGDDLRADLAGAQRVAILAQGAYLLYDLMLADASVDAGMAGRAALQDPIRARLGRWADELAAEEALLDGWRTAGLWDRLARWGVPVSPRTRWFLDAWAGFALEQPRALADLRPARDLLRARERGLKGALARLANLRALENWGEATGGEQLDYRWRIARMVIADVQAGGRRRDGGADGA